MKAPNREFYIFLSACMIAALAFSPYHALLTYPLKADDASYLSHAFTLGLEFNLRYENNIANWLTINGLSSAHPIGPGLLAAPFVAIFSVIDLIYGHAVISDIRQYQFSWARFGFVFSTVFYFLFGVVLYQKTLEKAKVKLSRILTLLFCSSFGVLYYVLYRPIMGHSYEFFALALCCYASTYVIFSIFENKKISSLYPFWIALSMNLTILIRPANIIVVLLPVVLFYLYRIAYQYNKVDHKRIIANTVNTILWFILLFTLIALINLNLYGMIFPSTTAMYGSVVDTMPKLASLQDILSAIGTLILRLPNIITIIFTSEFGLLFASPILIIGLIVLVESILKSNSNIYERLVLLVLLGAYLGLPLATVLFWQSPGDAYGFRFLFCWFPVAFISVCLWFKLTSFPSRYVIYVKNVVVCFCIFGLLSSTLYGINSKLMYSKVGNNCFDVAGDNIIGYEKEVLKACATPTLWLQLIATRFPGFMLLGMMDMLDYKINSNYFPESLQLKWLQWETQNQHVSKTIYIQSTIIYLFIFVFLWIYLRRRRLNDERNV